MDEISWGRLRRSLFFFVPIGFGLAFTALLLLVGLSDQIPVGDATSKGGDLATKENMCAPGAQPRFLDYRFLSWGNLWFYLVVVAIIVLVLIWCRRAKRDGLALAAYVAGGAAVVLVIWVAIGVYVSLHGGVVWFAPRCGGGV